MAYVERIESRLSTDIAAFPEAVRPQVMLGLRLAVDMLPTGDEYYRARRENNEWEMEKKYGVAADAFAMLIDQGYEPLSRSSGSSETAILRGDFYRMMRTLTSEQIHGALQKMEL